MVPSTNGSKPSSVGGALWRRRTGSTLIGDLIVMSRKDYLVAVSVIKSIPLDRKDPKIAVLIDTFVDFFQNDNPRFNPEKFRRACEK